MEGSIKNNGYFETPTPFYRLGDILVAQYHKRNIYQLRNVEDIKEYILDFGFLI